MEGEVNNVVSIVIYQSVTADWQRQSVDYLESLPCLILGECFKTLLSILELCIFHNCFSLSFVRDIFSDVITSRTKACPMRR